MAEATDSQINFASEITRIKAEEKVYKFASDPLTGPVSVWQLLGNVFARLQAFCNAVNQRLARLEARPEISPLISDTAGASAGYAVITISGQQYKFEIKAMS